MTPEQKQLLRDALVAALVASAPYSLPLATLKGAAMAAGFKLTDAEVEQHLDYLTKSGMASLSTARSLSAGVQRWETTADGVNYCEANDLA